MKRILLFVHFNKNGRLNKRALYTLEQTKHLYDKIVTISNSPLNKADRNTLERLSDDVIIRENKGYDFSAWKAGIDHIGWQSIVKYDSLTIMNDTCLFPVWPIDEYFDSFGQNNKVDFWGASIYKATPFGMPGSNKAVPEHIQSYFMTFKRTVVKSKSFRQFWESVKPHGDVTKVICDYETVVTKRLSDAGFKYDTIINRNSSIFSTDTIINPVYQVPVELIRSKFPFIKLKSINKFNFIEIKHIIKEKSSYPSKLVHIPGKSRIAELFYGILNTLIDKAHLAFLIIGIPAMIAFAYITPPGFGGDEMAHTLRAYSISQGHLFTVDNLVPSNLKDTVELGWNKAESTPWGKSAYGRQDIDNTVKIKLSELGSMKLRDSSLTTVKFNNTDPYSPIVYTGAAIAFKISQALDLTVANSIIFARILNSIPFFVLGALALSVLRKNYAKWILFVILLLPTVLSYAGTINGDPYNIASVSLFIALLLTSLQSRDKLSKRQLAMIAASAGLLSFAKLPSIALVGLLPFISKDRFDSSKNKWMIISSIIALSLLLFFASVKVGLTDVMSGSTSSDKITWSITHPTETIKLFGRTLLVESPDYINRAVGVMGRNGVYVHSIVILAIYVWLAILSLSVPERSRKTGLLILVYGLMLCSMVVGLLYVADPKNSTSDAVIFGVHGKYFTPFLALIFYSLGALSPFKITSGKGYLGIFTVFLMAFIALSSILSYTLALY